MVAVMDRSHITAPTLATGRKLSYDEAVKVAAFVDDLFFQSKISETAKRLGSEITFCRSAESVPAGTERICVDLNSTTFDALEEIRKLKSAHQVPIIAFLSHVQVELKRRAEEAGATQVLPRSVFSQQLVEILR